MFVHFDKNREKLKRVRIYLEERKGPVLPFRETFALSADEEHTEWKLKDDRISLEKGYEKMGAPSKWWRWSEVNKGKERIFCVRCFRVCLNPLTQRTPFARAIRKD